MKSVPNLISYIQEFSQIFPHIVSIFLVQKAILGISEKEKALTCGPRLSVAKPPHAAPGLAAQGGTAVAPRALRVSSRQRRTVPPSPVSEPRRRVSHVRAALP
jgi:hypothetical protein